MRETGVLLALSSLPAPGGVGDLGETARQWVDLLAENSVTVWQLLPLNPLGYGNSPYSPDSAFAGDEIYISLDELAAEGLLEKAEPPAFPAGRVDYDRVRRWKEPLLRRAWANFQPDEDYRAFCSRKWVQHYGVFRAFKRVNQGRNWTEWPSAYRDWPQQHSVDLVPLKDEIGYQMFLQYVFARQWRRLSDYAHQKGVWLMGDLPFYMGADSVDVWANREQFLLDGDGRPRFVTGVPPDSFSKTGQRWGHPAYDWAAMERDDFAFWMERMRHADTLFDLVRLDHFLGMDRYWKIPAACPTAVEGTWQEAPGERLLGTIFRELPDLQLQGGTECRKCRLTVVVEDLGVQSPRMRRLREQFGLMGMKIFQYDLYLDKKRPDLWPEPLAQQIFYTGTHDNATLREWYLSQPAARQRKLRKWLKRQGYLNGSPCGRVIDWVLDSPSALAIFPLVDLMELGSEGRMNLPGTVGSPNWEWRLTSLASAEIALRRHRSQILKRQAGSVAEVPLDGGGTKCRREKRSFGSAP
ncbi:MAG: 4-alpha-glucanotransferase [Clostridiales bacterium]|nr:4-alpha-glucanotransferase [Clostridiales bacterium]